MRNYDENMRFLNEQYCNTYHFYQKGMLHIENRLRKQIFQQISRNSTLIHYYLLPFCVILILSLFIPLQFYRLKSTE